MKKKPAIITITTLALAALLFTACIIDIPLTLARSFWGPEDAPYDTQGEYISGTARGYGTHQVTVHILLEEGYITSFRFEGGFSSTFETNIEGFRPAWEQLVLDSNSFDFPVTGSGATPTLRGIRTAGRNTLIREFGSITMADFSIHD